MSLSFFLTSSYPSSSPVFYSCCCSCCDVSASRRQPLLEDPPDMEDALRALSRSGRLLLHGRCELHLIPARRPRLLPYTLQLKFPTVLVNYRDCARNWWVFNALLLLPIFAGVNAPLTLMFFPYALLALFYGGILVYRRRKLLVLPLFFALFLGRKPGFQVLNGDVCLSSQLLD